MGALQELCISHRWAPPRYLLEGENGLPHEREFVITCVVENHQEIGVGKSKKLAKRQAAYRMLMKLKDTPIEVPNQGGGLEDEDEVSFRNENVVLHDHDFYRFVKTDCAKSFIKVWRFERKSIIQIISRY